jgi:hypothetical protein
MRQVRNNVLHVALLALLVSVVTLTAIGCTSDETYNHNPTDKPYLIHNGVSECVALPLTKFNDDPHPEHRGWSYNGHYLLKCGLTPKQAAEYAEHVERAIDYVP